jgi:hypothetical protein
MKVLSLAYSGNVQWFAKLLGGDCVIDVGEHYVKQSWRNRCEVLTAGGRTALTVNVAGGRAAMKDVRIDHSKRWRHAHRLTIVSAYGSAPYFDHYWPSLEPFFVRRYDFLWDLSRELLAEMLRLVGNPVAPVFSERYIDPREGIVDLRDALSPKVRLARPDPQFRPEPYWQVFAPEGGFVPNLSLIDLLMCEGPEAVDILRRSTASARGEAAPDL